MLDMTPKLLMKGNRVAFAQGTVTSHVSPTPLPQSQLSPPVEIIVIVLVN